MGLKKLIKKAGKFVKKAVKTAAPIALAATVGPAAAPLLAAGASPVGGLLGGSTGAAPAGSFSPQTGVQGLLDRLLEAGTSKAECAILGTCGQKSVAPVVAPAAAAVQAQSSSSISPMLVLGGLVALWLILRK